MALDALCAAQQLTANAAICGADDPNLLDALSARDGFRSQLDELVEGALKTHDLHYSDAPRIARLAAQSEEIGGFDHANLVLSRLSDKALEDLVRCESPRLSARPLSGRMALAANDIRLVSDVGQAAWNLDAEKFDAAIHDLSHLRLARESVWDFAVALEAEHTINGLVVLADGKNLARLERVFAAAESRTAFAKARDAFARREARQTWNDYHQIVDRLPLAKGQPVSSSMTRALAALPSGRRAAAIEAMSAQQAADVSKALDSEVLETRLTEDEQIKLAVLLARAQPGGTLGQMAAARTMPAPAVDMEPFAKLAEQIARSHGVDLHQLLSQLRRDMGAEARRPLDVGAFEAVHSSLNAIDRDLAKLKPGSARWNKAQEERAPLVTYAGLMVELAASNRNTDKALGEWVLRAELPARLNDHTRKVLDSLGLDPADIVSVPYTQTRNYRVGRCHANVERQIKDQGGSVQHGWLLWQNESATYTAAVFHSVWRAPDGRLVDVTPPFAGKAVSFVPDDTRKIDFAIEPPRKGRDSRVPIRGDTVVLKYGAKPVDGIERGRTKY